MTFNEEPAGRPGVSAIDAVAGSLGCAWNRMSFLLFRGPHASLATWIRWGLILLLAGVGVSGPGFQNRLTWRDDVPLGARDLGEIGSGVIALIVVAAILAFLLVLLVTWLQSRFRCVMLEGVRTGVPAIRGVFGRTARVGDAYFLFRVVLGAAVLALLAPVAVAWGLALWRQGPGRVESTGGFVAMLAATILWALLVAVAAAIVSWWVYDLALPYAWFGELSFGQGIAQAWALTTSRPSAVLLLLLFRILVGIASVIVILVGICCIAIWFWIVPLLVAVGLAMATVAVPLLAFVTVPLIVALALLLGWIGSTVTAPVPLLVRCWSACFVGTMDPSIEPWPGAPGERAPV